VAEGSIVRLSARTDAFAGEQLVRALYHAHGAAIMAYASRMTGDRALAEDVFQETMLRAWRQSDELSASAGSIRAWLFKTCRGIVIEQARRRDVRPPELPDSDSLPRVAGALNR
jgi:RNA polymerase sigma-70 factor (ECF subfamily)